MNTSELSVQPDSIEYAGNMLDRHDHLDSSAPTLVEVTGIVQHRMPTASGLNDYDYQNLSTLSMGLKHLNQMETVNKVPIPCEVMEHFKHIKCHCMMGLFPEIGRAWLTIDSDIYIWTYEHARDVAYFDGLSQLIVSVALVKPKPDVFIADVKFLLILTTPVEIVVLGVTFNDLKKSPTHRLSQPISPYEEMQLMSKPIFIVNTDNVAMTTIIGSNDYRIYLGGRDGCLYEIQYQAESNWFGKRCKKINHSQSLVSYMMPGFLKFFSEVDSIMKITIDNSRNILYTLTEKGSIEAWLLGTSSDATQRIAKITQNDIASFAGCILKTIDSAVFKPVITICPLTMEDSLNLHLLAVTQCGVRLYFSTTPLLQPTQANNNSPPVDLAKPQNLYLLHVRLPPGYTPNTTAGKPKNVHNAYYSKGNLLMMSTPQQDQDILWSISSEPFPLRPYLAESTTLITLNGQVWGVADVIEERPDEKVSNVLTIAKHEKKVVLLTNQGAHIVALKKQVHLLQQLLMACHGAHHEAVKGYFQSQTEPQACATSVLLACMYNGTEIGIWATQAFLLYGGEPHFQSANFMPDQTVPGPRHLNMSGTFLEQQSRGQMFMSTPFPSSRQPPPPGSPGQMQQTQFPLSPIPNQTFSQQQPPDLSNFGNLIYSSKHVGLYLHASRLMRPIWKRKCVSAQGQSSISYVDCANILDDLHAVKSFVESLPIGVAGYGSNYGNQSTLLGQVTNAYGSYGQNPAIQQKNAQELAITEEKKSTNALVSLIKHTCEVLSLWKILCEHQFHIIIQSLSKENQMVLQVCTFRDLVLDRTDMCALLILSLINIYLNDNASVGAISSKLRDICPNLYRHEDAVTHKATEILMTSKNCLDQEEYRAKLHTALQLCKDAAPNLPLSTICQQFVMAKYYQGVIELCATCAAKIDPNGAGLHFYKNKEPIADQEGYLALTARMNCYKEIKQMLDECFVRQNAQETTFGFMKNQNNNENEQVIEIVSLALQTPDQLLHIAVYEWLLSHNLLSELLDISEPSLGEFLAHSVIKHPDNTQLADILWRYYERNGQHSEATKILDDLASKQSNSVPLSQRIEYLARAVMCMRSDNVGYSAHNGVLLKNLEDKLEIARVQKLLLDALSSQNTAEAKEACQSLNFALYNITQLYTDFAERFDLWECKLTILNCSHHNDPKLIESVWTQILDKELQTSGTPYEKYSRMLSKVQTLANEFGNSSHCFPISFLVRDLELRCCQLKLTHSPVTEALLSMKLDVDMLLDIYRRMISMNERIWASEGNEWHLVLSTTRLLSILANQPNLIPTRNRRKNVSKPLDIISECRHLLYSKPDTKHMIEELDEIEIRLKRV